MRIFIALCLSVMTSSALACDVCGCSSGGFNSGLLNLSNSHFVGLQYKSRFFESSHPILFDGEKPTISREQFQTVELNARWMPWKHFQVLGAIPYNVLQRQEGAEVESNQGFGDASVLFQGVFSNQKDSSHFGFRIAFGGGVKLPTGNSDLVSAVYAEVIPNMQVGTGSWDAIFNSNGIFKYKKWFSSIDLSYNLNGVNAADYKYGNRTLAKISLGKWMTKQTSEWVFRPELAMQFLSARYDYNEFSKGITNEFSHGYFLDFAPAFQVQRKSWSVRLFGQLPVIQNFAEGNVKSVWVGGMQLFYLIPTKR